MEFLEVGGQVGSCPFSQGHDPALAALPVSVTLAGLSIPTSAMVSAASSPILAAVSYMRIRSMRFLRDLASPVPHAVTTALGVLLPEVVDGFARGWFDTYAGRVVAQRGQCRVFEARVVEEHAHRRHPQHDGAVRVPALGPHPFDPPAQARPVEMPETDVAALRAFRGFEPSDVGFQADAVRLDGLRRAAPHLGSQWCSQSRATRQKSGSPELAAVFLALLMVPPFPGPRVRRRRRGPRIRP